MIIQGVRVGILAWLLTFPMSGAAQRAERILSPEVHPDGSVTFRYVNSRATEVLLTGAMNHLPRVNGPLMRGTDSLWTRTTPPLEPGIYHYTFRVDGQQVLDPANTRRRSHGSAGAASLLLVPGTPPRPWEEQPDISHGSVVEEKLYSRVLGELKSCYVYLPPGYQDSQQRYPVFYLLHGSGDDASTWVHDGFADNIMDALIAQGRIRPMIGVFPDGQVGPLSDSRRGDPAARAQRTTLHTEYFLTEVVPFVESRYRIAAQGTHRAIAGLSMGGGQTFHVALRHPHLFSAVAPLSAAIMMSPERTDPLVDILPVQKEAINRYFRLFFIACGASDFLIENNRQFSQRLTEVGIRHEFHELPGAHTWTFWTARVAEFLPLFSAGIPVTPGP